MTTPATDAPPAPAPEAPAQPAAAAPAPPVPQPPREPDGRFAAPQPPAAPAQPPAAAQPADSTDWRAEAERARAETVRLKAEADQWKAQSRRQETRSKLNHQELQNRDALLREIAAKVGVEFDDHPDPEVLQQRLSEQTSLARQSAVELAVFRQAASAPGVNASSLLDSREFMNRTSALDPDAADFHAQLADLVREAAGQPRYQFQQPPPPPAPVPELAQQQPPAQQQAPVQPPSSQPPAPASGADFSGAPRPSSLWTQADYDSYMASSHKDDRDGKKLSAAIDAGLLTNLGIGRPKKRGGR